jgi:F420H(2)-dependent quinone reductase
VKSYRGLLVLLGAIPLLVAGGSYLAGEQIEVVALRTLDSEGHPHDTKLWIVDYQGRPWVRAARPKLGWVERIRANPRVELVRGGKTEAYTAEIVESPDEKRAIDAAVSAKYGWVDRWYEFVVRHETTPIRLDPDGASPPAR